MFELTLTGRGKTKPSDIFVTEQPKWWLVCIHVGQRVYCGHVCLLVGHRSQAAGEGDERGKEATEAAGSELRRGVLWGSWRWVEHNGFMFVWLFLCLFLSLCLWLLMCVCVWGHGKERSSSVGWDFLPALSVCGCAFDAAQLMRLLLTWSEGFGMHL